MKVENIRFESFDLGSGSIPYTMVVCDVALTGKTIKCVAENIGDGDIDWTDSNIEHNEDRLNDDQKQEVMQVLSQWVKDSVSALDDYIHYMNTEHDKNWDWYFDNGELVIEGYEISPEKLEEIKGTSGSDYFNIELWG